MKPIDQKSLENHVIVRNVKTAKRNPEALNFYCGRGFAPQGLRPASLGNPFNMDSEESRAQVCRDYQHLLKGRFDQIKSPHTPEGIKRAQQKHILGIKNIAIAAANNPDKPIHLYCFCAPLRCHCEVIRARLIVMLGNHWAIGSEKGYAPERE